MWVFPVLLVYLRRTVLDYDNTVGRTREKVLEFELASKPHSISDHASPSNIELFIKYNFFTK